MWRAWAVTAAALALALVLAPGPEAEAGPGAVAEWERLIRADGAVDLAGPLDDGRFALTAGGRLFLLDVGRPRKRPFARGRDGYSSVAGEPYIALAERIPDAACRFRDGDLFALEPRDDPGVLRISPSGRARRFVSFPDGVFLSGIAFDRVGSFGHRLLVAGLHDRKSSTTLYAIDCRGRREKIVSEAPRIEGGIEVAPPSFGAFGGNLAAVDELSGKLYAFSPAGTVATIAESGLPAGGDVGVEAVGFVPSGFGPGDLALLSDFGVKPGVGTDSVLSIRGSELAAAGVAPGDMLVATETGAETIRVRCAASCDVAVVASGPEIAHAEGHIEFTGLATARAAGWVG